MSKFIVKHGEILVQAFFRSPMFSLLDPPGSRFHSVMFANFGRYGLTVGDVRIENGLPNLSDGNITYNLSILKATIKVFLDRIEVTFFDTPHVQRAIVNEVFEKAMKSVEEIAPGTQMREFMVAVSLHGLIDGEATSEYISSFISRVPLGIAPNAGQGVVFYYRGNEKAKGSSLVLDLSARVIDGLYFRISFTWDGLKVSGSELASLVETSFDDACNNIGLQLE